MHHDGTSLFIAFFDVAINLKMKVFFILYVIILLISMTISRILFFYKTTNKQYCWNLLFLALINCKNYLDIVNEQRTSL